MKKYFFTILLAFFVTIPLSAQEGMWLLTQLDNLNLKEKGLEIDVDKIYHPEKPSLSDAILRLPGATGSFVSPNGLILTNHHVAYSAIQRASTMGEDYLTNGFLAKDMSEEIEAPGYTARLLIEMKDVTEELLPQVKDITDPAEADEKIDELIDAMTEKAIGGKDDMASDVVAMYNGKQYILFVYKVYSDIRIVLAPPESIGNYGDDIDNWMWPRHTGDFTFLRCYMAPDGSGRKYDPENIPVKPKMWLKMSTGDLDDEDFNFVLGYPGRTVRYRTSNSVDWNLHKSYPLTIKNYTEIIDMIHQFSKESNDVRITLADFESGLANALKNVQGMVDGMTKTNFLQKKINFENELMAFISKDEELNKQYGSVLNDIKAQYDVLEQTREYGDVMGNFGFLSGTLESVGSQIYNFVKRFDEMDADKKAASFDKEVERTANQFNITYMGYYEPFDISMLKRQLKSADQLPEGSRIAGLEYILTDETKSIDQFVDEAYQNSKLGDVEVAQSYLKLSLDELKELNDPFINIAMNLESERNNLNERYGKFGANINHYRKLYLDAVYAWKGSGMYPDANFTMRFAYGYVRGYKPADAVWYYPFTTLSGVIEKNTGVVPFNAPDELVDLFNKKDFGNYVDPDLKDVPIAFTNILESTGGNSGSPVLNAKGEVIGALFDGNYESMTSDWQFDYDIQRSITVDSRYILFITEKLFKADYLLKEMGLK